MGIKIIATDMDGTLLNSRKELPEGFYEWVNNNPDRRVVIASGRQLYTLLKDFSEVEDKLIFIAENGGLVYEKGNIIYTNRLSDENIRKCFEIFNTIPGVCPVICGVSSAYMIGADKTAYENAAKYYARLKLINSVDEAIKGDEIVKLALFVHEEKAEECLKHFNGMKEWINVVLSGVSWIDFANYSATKGNALKNVMDRYGIDRSEAMAFGDYLNDYTMLEVCEESYCMANGHEELKKLAKHIAKSNDENGVMEVLKKLK